VSSKDVGTGLYRNAVSYFGGLVMIVSAALVLFSLIAGMTLAQPSPYLGIFTYLIFPGILVGGLLMFLIGMRWEAGRRRKHNTNEALPYPHVDLNDAPTRKRFAWVLVGGSLIGILLALTGYNGFLFTESVTFCGKTCHTVMEPEFTAYSHSPHARVKCAECHVGEGAGWYVKSKLSGARQVLAVAIGSYERPIPVPIKDLRPARETCEHCHWPEKFYGSKLLQIPHFRFDEHNTAEQISLTVKTGGGSRKLGLSSGIHWHMLLEHQVTFGASDEHLQVVPWIQVRSADGKITEYTAPGYDPAKNGELRKRTMDCMDCHNRPTHAFQPPDGAIDKALYSNLIARDLPWIKKTTLEALVEPYPDGATARAEILRRITDFYKQRYPQIAEQRAADIRKAADVAAGIWERNVFPKMKVDWKTYPDNIGHRNWPGCFRCHDNQHKTKEGKVLTMECTVCHTMPERGPQGGLGDVPTSSEPDWHPWDLPAKHLAIEAHKNVLCSACHQAGLLPRHECKDCHK